MSKPDKSENFRELYVQYSYLKKDVLIFAKIREITNDAISIRTLKTYKDKWMATGLMKELKVQKAKDDKLYGKRQRERQEVSTVIHSKVEKSRKRKIIPPEAMKGRKPAEIIKSICNEYTKAEDTLEYLLHTYGMTITDFNRIVSKDSELAMYFENSQKIQRRNLATFMMDNSIMWLKKTSAGTSEVKETIVYEVKAVVDEKDPNIIQYVDIPVRKFVTKTTRPPSGNMLNTLLQSIKDALHVDITKHEDFIKMAEGYNIDQVDDEIRMLEELKQTRLNERNESNALRNRPENQHAETDKAE